MEVLIAIAICAGFYFVVQTIKSGQRQEAHRHQLDVALRAKESIERDFPHEVAVVQHILAAEKAVTDLQPTQRAGIRSHPFVY